MAQAAVIVMIALTGLIALSAFGFVALLVVRSGHARFETVGRHTVGQSDNPDDPDNDHPNDPQHDAAADDADKD